MYKDNLLVGTGLVIFDCDGVIADSESITMTVLSNMLADIGCDIPANVAIERYRGRKVAGVIEEIESECNIQVPTGFTELFRERCLVQLSKGLKASDGLVDVLTSLEEPYCVASSAPVQKIRHVLNCVGLLPAFEGRIFSAYDIQSWKPDPDLFLHAANYFGKKPHQCAVIEDSLPGITAGLAANMTTFAYLPYDNSPSIEGSDAIGFRSMYELPNLLANWRATSVAVSNHEAEYFFQSAR